MIQDGDHWVSSTSSRAGNELVVAPEGGLGEEASSDRSAGGRLMPSSMSWLRINKQAGRGMIIT